MTTTNVPSDQFDDLKRDVEDATRYSNSETVFTNRVGKQIRPIALQAQDIADNLAAAEQALANSGFIPKGDFTTGGTVEAKNEVFSDSADYWRYDGALPFTVTAGSSPTPTGVGAWINVSDGTLRSQLADPNSTVLIGGVEANYLKDKYTSVREFGAVGDGTTDDTAALQSALDSGNSLYWPAGQYFITSTLTLNRNSSWLGEGPFKSYIRNGITTDSPALIITDTSSPDPFPSVRYNSFVNFGIIGGLSGTGSIGDNPNNGTGLLLDSASWLMFENVALFANRRGVEFGDFTIAVRFLRCILKANREYGVLDAEHPSLGAEAVDCSFVETNIEQSDYGAVVNSGKMRFVGCTIEANNITDIEAFSEVEISGNYFETSVDGTVSTPRTFIKMHPGAYGSQVSNNKFLANDKEYVICVDYENHHTCVGNVFNNVNTSKNSQAVKYNGAGSTASVWAGNIDVTNADFGDDNVYRFDQNSASVRGLRFYNDPLLSSDTLDYYKEGSFTPIVTGTTSSGAGTYTYNAGNYTRIGNRVMFDISLYWTAHTGTGNVRVNGLPFTSRASLPLTSLSLSNTSLVYDAGKQLTASIPTGQDYIEVQQVDPASGAVSGVPLEDGTVILHLSGSYAV